MILARVEERQVVSEKHPRFEGAKLLWVREIGPEGEGASFLSIDTVGAGPGETVLVTTEGGASILAFGQPRSPLDSSIVGIVDSLNVADS